MWIGASGAAIAHDLAELLRRDRAQAVRRDAQRVAARLAPCASVRRTASRTCTMLCTKRRWPRRGGDAAEVAVRVEDGQQRQPDARRAGGRDDAPRELRRDPRTACRADRDGRSGIRRPTRSPPSPSRRRPARRSPRTRRHRGDRPRRTSPGATSRMYRRDAATAARCGRRSRAGTRANAGSASRE